MKDANPYERIVTALHEAALDDTRWPATSALIDEAFGASGNSIVFADESTPGDIRILLARFLYRGERHLEFEQEYFTDYYHLDERVPRVRRLPDSQIVHVTELYTDDERKRSLVYNQALSRGFVQDSLNVRLDGPGGSRIAWVINDPVEDTGWSSEQIELVRRVLPHLRHYLGVRRVLDEAGALGESLASLLDETGSGVLHLDRHGRIVEANDVARDVLRRGDALYDHGGRLQARALGENEALQRLLARALTPLDDERSGGSMVVRGWNVLAGSRVHVSPLGETEFGAPQIAALVLVVEPERPSRIDPDLVGAALGLTPAESRIAVRLAGGESVQQIMAATGRSEHTIRWHMRQIFQKHRLTRQGELIRLVLSLPRLSEPPH